MTSMEHYIGGQPPVQSSRPGDVLTSQVIRDELAAFSNMNRSAMFNTLVPHRSLPEHDVARTVIDVSRGQRSDNGDDLMLETGYELGVVFGRSLLVRATKELPGTDLPVVTDFDPQRQRLVDRYLARSRRRALLRLTSRDGEFHPDLASAVDLFCEQCKIKVPDVMLGGQEAVRRGVHDYLSVVDLLEADESTQRTVLKRRLGHMGVLGLTLSSIFADRFRRFSEPPRGS